MAESYSLQAELSAVDKGYTKAISTAIKTMDTLVSSIDAMNSVSNSAGRSISKIGDELNSVGKIGNKSLDNLYGKFGSANKSAGIFGGTIGQIAKGFTLGNVISKGMNKVTNSFGSAINRLDTLNQFPKMMESWGYSMEDANKSKDKLVKGIDGLPTTLNDIVGNVQTLVTSGLELDEATDVAIALNNAFLANGASSADASRGLRQYSQMLAKGKVDQMSWYTLVETSGKALNDISEELLGAGKNQTHLYEALQDGTITFDEFNKKLVEADVAVGGFAEQALIGSEGIATSMTNISTAVNNALASVVDAFDKTLQSKGLGTLAQIITNLKGPIADFGKSVEKMVPGLVDGFLKLNKLDLVTILALPTALKYVSNFGSGLLGVTNAFSKVGSSSAGLFSGLGSEILDIGSAFDGAMGKTSGFLDNISKLVPIQGKFGAVMKGSLSGLGKLSTVAGKAGGAFASMSNLMLNTAGTMLQGVIAMVNLSLNAIGPVAILGMLLGGLGIISKSYGDVIKQGIENLQKNLPTMISNLTKTIWEKMNELVPLGISLFVDIANLIAQNIPLITESFMRLLFSLVNLVIQNKDVLIDSFLSILSAITDAIATYGPELLLAGTYILSSILSGLVADNKIFEFITSFIEKITQSFEDNKDGIMNNGRIIIQSLINGAFQMFEALSPFVVDLVNAISNYISENSDQIVGTGIKILGFILNGLLDNIFLFAGVGIDIIDSLVNSIIENKEEIVTGTKELMNKMKDFIIEYGPKVLGIGAKLIKFIAESLSENSGDILTSAIEIVTKLANYIIDNLDKIVNTGGKIIWNLLVGIVKAMPELLSGISQVIWNLITTILGLGDDVKGAGSDIINNLIDGIVSKAIDLYDSVKRIFKNVRDLLPFSPPKDSSSPFAKLHKNGIMEQIAKGVYSGENELDSAMKSVMDTVNPELNDVRGSLNYSEDIGNSEITHSINDMNSSQKPAYVNLSLGGNEFRTFVSDINKEQDIMNQLNLT